ncbi:Armadillo-like helical [Cynara cardunculus var. scolymus]|uniref:Armadillo-like helical n=1 Tax=Cynara cardunculus var. scolymus TaxID=59895 RepID=A0A118K1S7_CYNCS|nr:Armadillo-like helical [Cynara cardunculus var. scolymus]
MEQKLLSSLEQIFRIQTKISLKPFSMARSLILNPSTSDQTISSILQILETLSTATINPKFDLLNFITLLCEISIVHRHFSPTVTTILRSLCLHCPSIPPRAAGLALSTLVSIAPASASDLGPAFSEGLFLSLCFGPCVPVRQRLLMDAEKFRVRPSVLLTVLLGFTKDPYPYVRKAALDGLIDFCKWIVVNDHLMVEGCYLRAVELLFDTEECLCSMVRDMSKKVRIEAFNTLGKAGMASEYILMQTLSKKVLPTTKEKMFPGQLSGKLLSLPASSAAGAFIHGLEDEFFEVRSSACYALRMPAVLSADFAAGALGLLMDVLNDDSTVVRLQALETMHHMAVFGHLKVQEMHMHMPCWILVQWLAHLPCFLISYCLIPQFLGTLVDMNSSIRFTARKVLRLTKLHDLPLFKLAADSLIQSLEIYPQDEPDVLSLIFDIGRRHGSFAVSITKEILSEIEPSSESTCDFNSSKTAARLVLAISAPLSHGKQQQLHSIPSILYSYAVTMLGRISHCLTEVMNQDTLLAYLSYCSRSTGVNPIDSVKMVEDDLPTETNGRLTCCVRLDMVHMSDGGSEIQSQGLLEPSQIAVPHVADNCVKFILANIGEIWDMTKLGCISEVLMTLRSWKEELATFITDSHQSDSVLILTLQYLHLVKLLSKAWWHVTCPINFIYNEMGNLGYILQKLESTLREVRCRFIGLSKEDELHFLELMLVACTLRLSIFDASCPESALTKLYSTKSRVMLLYEDCSIEPSRFVSELIKVLQKNDTCDISRFRESLEFFSLNQLVFSGSFRYMKAEVDIGDNDWLKPLPFVAGLPVDIPLKIRLHNTPIETKVWLEMRMSKDLNQYVFVDLKLFDGSDEIREFTFIAPFYRTPKVNSFILRLSVGMECLSEEINYFRGHGGPKHELVYLCKEKEVFLSMVVKQC